MTHVPTMSGGHARSSAVSDSGGNHLACAICRDRCAVWGHNVEVAVLLGVVTAVSGGVLRDVLLNRVPVILGREVCALAALAGAGIEVSGQRLAWFSSGRTRWL